MPTALETDAFECSSIIVVAAVSVVADRPGAAMGFLLLGPVLNEEARVLVDAVSRSWGWGVVQPTTLR